MTSATPEWAELLQTAAAAHSFDLHTAMPGQVVAVHADAASKLQLVDVRPCLRRAIETDTDGAQPFVEEELPILPRVPLGIAQGGGFFMSLPIAVGDFVTLIFAERSIDRWLATAKKARQAAVSTGDVGTHTLDGAIALPCGPAPLGELLDGVSSTDLVIGGPAGILARFTTSGDIVLAEGDTPVALAGKSGTEFDRIKHDIQTLKGAVSTGLAACMPGNGSATASTFDTATEAIPSTPGNVAAAKVKAR